MLLASGNRDISSLPPDLADARFILKPFGTDKLRDAIEPLLTARC